MGDIAVLYHGMLGSHNRQLDRAVEGRWVASGGVVVQQRVSARGGSARRKIEVELVLSGELERRPLLGGSPERLWRCTVAAVLPYHDVADVGDARRRREISGCTMPQRADVDKPAACCASHGRPVGRLRRHGAEELWLRKIG